MDISCTRIGEPTSGDRQAGESKWRVLWDCPECNRPKSEKLVARSAEAIRVVIRAGYCPDENCRANRKGKGRK